MGGGGAPKPTFGTGVLGRPSSARAPSASVEGVGGMEVELLAIEVEVAMELTLRRWRVTDEALMEEASRYSAGPISSSALGLRGSSSSSSF